ncbi:kinase-like domain-containing protein [Xylaria digitata]|nr:kinase-like domain-containing protein [Xylaria digitata]
MVSKAIIEFARSVEENYENAKYWEFEKLLGAGGFGVAILAREREYIGAYRKRIAIKLAQPAGVRSLQKEIEWLKILNGGKHIVEMLAYCDDLIAAANEADKRNKLMETIESAFVNFGKLSTVPPMTAFDTLAGVKGPALALEYIEGGDLLNFIRPGDGLDEHYVGQTLKLIDFGAAFDYLVPRNGPQDNLYDAAQIIVNLFDTLPMRKVVVRWENIDTRAGAILPIGGQDPMSYIDMELRHLIARCMDTSPYRRPPLEEVLRITTQAVFTRKPASFPEPRLETNHAIRRWWQQILYDASDE